MKSKKAARKKDCWLSDVNACVTQYGNLLEERIKAEAEQKATLDKTPNERRPDWSTLYAPNRLYYRALRLVQEGDRYYIQGKKLLRWELIGYTEYHNNFTKHHVTYSFRTPGDAYQYIQHWYGEGGWKMMRQTKCRTQEIVIG